MANKELAKEILSGVGGEENIDTLTHCTTRLRFKLKDIDKADSVRLRETKGVLGVLVSRGYYMVVIGKGVADVYNGIKNITLDNRMKNVTDRDKARENGFTVFLIYTTLVAGIIYTAAALVDIFGIINVNGDVLEVLRVLAGFGIYLLPVVFLRYSNKKTAKAEKSGIRIINAPVRGRAISLSETGYGNDGNEGAGIIPESNLIVAPFSGIVTDVSERYNGVGLISDEGTEIYVQVGEEDNAGRDAFKAFVREGEKVRMGDPLIEMDKNALEIEGVDIKTAVVVVGAQGFARVRRITDMVQEQKPFLEIWE